MVNGACLLSRAPVVMSGASQLDIRSAWGSVYRIGIWRPALPPSAAGYPVVFLLDGNAVFGTAVDILRLRSERPDPVRTSGAVVVAIGYPVDGAVDRDRRAFDLTPPPAAGGSSSPASGASPWPATGGGDAFLDFVQGEVMPLVAREVPADPARSSLFGHSFGGLLALHCLFTRPGAFANYVAASPSIWWNDGCLLRTEQAFCGHGKVAHPTRVLLTAGTREGSGPRCGSSSEQPSIADRAAAMALRLQTVPGILARFTAFPGETHGSVIPAALARGLTFIAEQEDT